ncbi:MAG: hypothetical protein K2L75_00790 [Muribaculaceae bacterium]|nr:hypothetical protein [Muribaculaceae bacterium]MDE6612039.1 hypothetical protein [Muribaculaceae bacterium]
MKEKAVKILYAALLLVFVNFVFSNTVFIHSHHISGGRSVTHSHPYLPSSHHSHNAQELSLIASFNMTAASAMEADFAPVFSAPLCYTVIEQECVQAATAASLPGAKLRGPPLV